MFFIILFILTFTQCWSQPGGEVDLFSPTLCTPDPKGRVAQLSINQEWYTQYKGGYIACDVPREMRQTQHVVDKELQKSEGWDAYEVPVAAFTDKDDQGNWTGIVLPSVGFTEQYVVDSNQATLDVLKEKYPDAFFVSCLRGGIPIQEVARRDGINVHLGVLSSRDVTQQRDVVCDFNMLPWDEVERHGNTIVFWDDITDTGKTAAEFLFWCFQNKVIKKGVKVVLAFNHGKDGHPHEEGDVEYGFGDGQILDEATMRDRIIRRLVEIARKAAGLPLNKAYVTSEEFKADYAKWEKFFNETVEEAFFTEYLAGKWVVFPAEGGDLLVRNKPDTSVLKEGEKYDVLLGCAKLPVTEDDARLHILTQQSLLSNITDELMNFDQVGYVFADVYNPEASGEPRLAFKHNRKVTDRVLCYLTVPGYEKPQADFAEAVKVRCGYKETLAVSSLVQEVYRPFPVLPGITKHEADRKKHVIHPVEQATLKPGGGQY